MSMLTLIVVLALILLAAKLIGGHGRLASRTTTRRFLGLRASVRGIANLRSVYLPLPFGYRWVFWERAPRRGGRS